MTDRTEATRGRVAIIRVRTIGSMSSITALLVLILAEVLPGAARSNPALERFFRQNIGLTADQVSAGRNGQPVAKALPSREPAEVFLFGAMEPDPSRHVLNPFNRLRLAFALLDGNTAFQTSSQATVKRRLSCSSRSRNCLSYPETSIRTDVGADQQFPDVLS